VFKLTIFFVDDNSATGVVAAKKLEKDGYCVTLTKTGLQALKNFRK
jgi:CheY-like chemotaxis protein